MIRSRALAPAVTILVALTGCSSPAKPASAPASTTTTISFLGPVSLDKEQAVADLYKQGVARVPGGWIFSGTDGLWRADETAHAVRSLTPAIPAAWATRGYSHIGDIDVIGNIIYAPLEQPHYEKGQQATARFDRDTLRFIDAVLLPQHENSFVSIDPATMIAYSMDHFDGDSVLRYDVAQHWKPLAPLRMNMLLHHTQGADVAHGFLWISTSDATNDLFRVELTTGNTKLVSTLGHVSGEGEGIDATDLPSGFLHTLCVDPNKAPVWFGHFRAGP